VTHPLDNDRFRFFFRHRDDIREWAAIEQEIIAATRELLGALLPDLDELLRAIDPDVAVVRFDGGRTYERIHVRHEGWPSGVGMTLEWETSVDPFGGSLPKWGVFFLDGNPEHAPAKALITERLRGSQNLRSEGYVPGDSYWPIVRRIPKSATWWQDPAGWAAPITDALVALWPQVAPVIDKAFAASPAA